MSFALQHSLNDLLSHESDAEMSPLGGGLDGGGLELMDHPVNIVSLFIP